MTVTAGRAGLTETLAVLETARAEFAGVWRTISAYGREDDPEAAALRAELGSLIGRIDASVAWLRMVLAAVPPAAAP